ncbi:WcaI family glycosyltransferase [Hephaestia sp. GCM10023244]|uniref:WcaI family glycosyltransferase n=1 Tax=unclassified Hephaestia TaxID=2631281 RepID=UPI002077716A|nr:WcaI family glycosyltransferase [Hephaestia sp. MAHUQ-44]MCM8732539.1 WcaI family glycosyltransferase [Hephaestia sp. MAHUQ-44]
MRILLLGLNYAPEEIGIGLYSGDMARALAASGKQVRAIVAKPYYPAWKVFDGYSGKRWEREVDEGVDVTRCPLYVPAKPTGLRRILHLISFAAAAFVPTVKAGYKIRPHVVFTTAPSLIAAPIAWLVGWLTRAKTWLHIQDFEIEAAFATGLIDPDTLPARIAAKVENWILQRFDVVSSISPQMCAALVRKGVDPTRIYEFRNWADVDAVRPLGGESLYRTEWGITTPYVALYAGNIANKQGIEIVLEAAAALRDRTDLTFVICGEGQNRARLERAAAQLGNVQIHDLQPRERLGELLGLATVHLLPQLADAADLVLPSKLTNMLASGRPVVATADVDTGLAAEVAGCGITTPPGNAQLFATAITDLLDAAKRRTLLGQTARLRAEERWSKTAILDRFTEKLARIVDNADP